MTRFVGREKELDLLVRLWNSARAGNGQASLYVWFYEAIYVPMQSTMFALLAFSLYYFARKPLKTEG